MPANEIPTLDVPPSAPLEASIVQHEVLNAPCAQLDERILADWNWILAELNAGRLRSYRGQHIAVVDAAVVASAKSSLELEEDVANQLNVDKDRLVIFFVE